MDLGPDPRTPTMSMAEWARRIAAQDRAFAAQTSGDGPHEYLVQMLFYTVNRIQHPRQWGYTFLNAGASQCVCCFVFADGSPTQLLPIGESRSAQECWWICFVIWEENETVLPFVIALRWHGRTHGHGVSMSAVFGRSCERAGLLYSSVQARV